MHPSGLRCRVSSGRLRPRQIFFCLVDLLHRGPPLVSQGESSSAVPWGTTLSRWAYQQAPPPRKRPGSSVKDTWRGFSTGGIYVTNTCCRRKGGREGERELKRMCDTKDMRSCSPKNEKKKRNLALSAAQVAVSGDFWGRPQTPVKIVGLRFHQLRYFSGQTTQQFGKQKKTKWSRLNPRLKLD